MVMSYSERGKLGAAKVAARLQLEKQNRIDEYNKNPNLCLNCNNPVPFRKRKTERKFCTQSCAATFNNKNKEWKRTRKEQVCSLCAQVFTPPFQYTSRRCPECFTVPELPRHRGLNSRISQNRKKYEENPYICLVCPNPIKFKFRNNVYCSTECSKAGNGPVNIKQDRICFRCNKVWTPKIKTTGIHCPECHGTDRIKIPFEDLKTNSSRKKRLIEERSHKCEVCMHTEWLGSPISLEVDHIDGDHEHNSKENLRLICPNCHSKTATYKGRNRGKGRSKRMQRYYDGKSY